MTAALVPVNDSQSGHLIQINDFLKDPLLLQEVVLSMMNQSFLADTLLRNAGLTQSGMIRYRESSPLYANSDPMVRAEFAEVPIADVSVGKPMIALVEELALGAVISDEMKRRQNFDAMQRQLSAIRNSMTRKWDRTLFRLLFTHPRVQRMVVDRPWEDPTSKQRIDIYDAKRLVAEASADNTPDAEFGFEANTLVIGRGLEASLFASDEFNKLYMNSPAITEAPLYKGQLDRKIYGLDVFVSPLPELDDKAVVMQRGVAGFIADELPLTVTPLYRVEEKKYSRADVQRASAAGLDQPKAVVVLEGLAA
ncbi:major capsid protein [Microcystis phage Mwe-JY05]